MLQENNLTRENHECYGTEIGRENHECHGTEIHRENHKCHGTEIDSNNLDCEKVTGISTQTPKATCVKSTQVEKIETNSQGVMTMVEMVNCEVQTDISLFNSCDVSVQCKLDEEEDNDVEDINAELESDDEDWLPNDGGDDDDNDGDDVEVDDDNNEDDGVDNEIDITNNEEPDETKERKYIVFESCIRALLSVCLICFGCCRVLIKRFHGTMVVMEAVCDNGHVRQWSSQPIVNKLPLGNLMLAGGILFGGCSPSNVLNCLNHCKILTFSERTFRRIQAAYLIPAVNNVWKTCQTRAMMRCEGRNVKLGGDARCCSPGHTAKYGSYSLMDLETGLILAIELIQVTEVKNSYNMEIEGLKRGLAVLKSRNIHVTDLTTDRHSQVKKYMRTEESCIKHWFDVWHVAKGVFKNIMSISKKRDCKILEKWAHSISNHLYWCAASSNGDGDLVQEKWSSISNHVCNIHEGHGNLYPICQHEDLDRTKWLKQGSKVHKELCAILYSGHLIKDIKKLSPAEQTSKLEAYHKVVCQFAPKFLHFFYDAMNARLLLAAIHNNENADRNQARKKDGTLRWKISYPKYKQGGHVVKPVKEDCTYDYIMELMEELVRLRERFATYAASVQHYAHQVPAHSSEYAPRVIKEDAVLAHRTRFNRNML